MSSLLLEILEGAQRGNTAPRIALIGAGGKTTLMFALTEALTRCRQRVVVTTTTKIWAPRGLPIVMADSPGGLQRLAKALKQWDAVVLGDHIGPDGKLVGILPAAVCSVADRFPDVAVVCEADGSAGRPLKIHESHEPAIPPCSSLVAVVAGMDAVGQAADDRTVHRLPTLAEVFPDAVGKPVTPHLVAALLARAAPDVPPGAATLFVLSKADSPERVAAAHAVARVLTAMEPSARVMTVVHGVPIDLQPVAGWGPESASAGA